jgi:List-Bact-rpt repeat protein
VIPRPAIRSAVLMALLVGLLSPAGPARSREGSPRLATPQLLDRAVARGRLNRSTADLYLAYAIGAPKRLPEAYASPVPWDGTLPLLLLSQRVAGMRRGPARARIQAALAGGACGEETGANTSTSTSHFYIEYQAIQGGLSITNYETSLETTWTTEVDSFDWAAPPLHPSVPGGKYHVVVDTLTSGLYGFVTTVGTYAGLAGDNPNTAWTEPDAFRTCMALNRNYGPPFPGTPQQALDATTAHEFNHSIQFGYGALTGANEPDLVFTEGGATWMEDEVFDAANDNYNYLWPTFAVSMGEYTPSPYPYWVVFRALTERFGTGTSGGGEDVMQDFWEAVSQSGSAIDLNALNTGLGNQGTTLPDAYHAAAIALKFNMACTGGVVYPYCLEEGPAYVVHDPPGPASQVGPTPLHGTIGSAGGVHNGSVQDNYALNWVGLPSVGPYSVNLQNNSTSGGQLRGSVACPTASGMSVFPMPSVVGPATSTALTSFDPTTCSSPPVAVITNEAQTAPDPPSSAVRSYTLSTGAVGPWHALTVATQGDGAVSSTPPGIACPPDCSETYPAGTGVALTPAPAPAWAFAGWTGDCGGASITCTVNMSVDRSVTATFIGPKSVTLSAKPKKVEKGERTRLTAVVSPCAGHEGDLVEFYRGAGKIKTKPSNASCTAKVRVRMKKTARFQAVSPKQDDDHLAGTSNKVKVRVLPA